MKSAKAQFLAEHQRKGEHYAGIILGKDGEPDYHLFLIPGESESANWEDSKKWAASVGGELPTRREQSMLFANLKELFKSAWYWSREQHAAGSSSAWYQYFGDGDQYYIIKSYKLRAVAVRRLEIL